MISPLLLALAAQAVARQAPPLAPPRITAQIVAAAVRARLPQRFGVDTMLVSAAAEGDLLILTYEVGPDMMRAATPETIAALLSAGFCAAAPARASLEGPMAMRTDARTADGRMVTGAVLDRCPAVSPAP